MKTFCSILPLAALLLFAGTEPMRAQQTEEEPAPHGSNWYILAGLGANTVFQADALAWPGLGAEAGFGKWVTPSLALEFTASGLRNRPNGTATGWFSGREPFRFYQGDLSLLWNINNTFGNPRHDRFLNVIPLLRAGAIAYRQRDERAWGVEPGAGAGLRMTFRLGRRWDLYAEGTATAAREKAFRERGSVAVFPSAMAGLVLKVGSQGFGPKNRGVEPEYIYQPVYVRDTVEVEHEVEKEKIVEVVDSVFIRQLRETPLTLYFEIDQTVLTDREKAHLERYAHFVLTPDTAVTLIGSADKDTGNSEHNQELSEGRCATVKAILVSVYGLKPENITMIANGDRKNEFNTPEKNRCVTLIINDVTQVSR